MRIVIFGILRVNSFSSLYINKIGKKKTWFIFKFKFYNFSFKIWNVDDKEQIYQSTVISGGFSVNFVFISFISCFLY